MSDKKSFLDAIESDPKNYEHRYVYADWLDEHGEPEEADRQRKYEAAERWLEGFADEARMHYRTMLERVADYAKHDDLWIEQGSEYARDAWYASGGDEFWIHFETVTGIKKPTDPCAPFSCSC